MKSTYEVNFLAAGTTGKAHTFAQTLKRGQGLSTVTLLDADMDVLALRTNVVCLS